MVLKISQAIEFHNVYSIIKEQAMPIKIAYRLNQIEQECEKKNNFYEITMKDIISRYSEKDNEGNPVILEDGKSIKIKSESIEDCSKDIQELSELEVELPDISFTLDELEILKLSLIEVKALMPFIKENKE